MPQKIEVHGKGKKFKIQWGNPDYSVTPSIQHRYGTVLNKKTVDKKIIFDSVYNYLPPRTWCLIYFLSDSIRFQNLRSTWTSSFSAAPERTYRNIFERDRRSTLFTSGYTRIHLSLHWLLPRFNCTGNLFLKTREFCFLVIETNPAVT
jgi:hypothetical protein